VTADMIETQNTANQLKRKLESHGHKLHMDNFLSLSNLFNDLTNRKSTAPEDTYQNINAAKPTIKQLKQDDIYLKAKPKLHN
jgi:hypothetical protein